MSKISLGAFILFIAIVTFLAYKVMQKTENTSMDVNQVNVDANVQSQIDSIRQNATAPLELPKE
jgi:hypothetical protein